MASTMATMAILNAKCLSTKSMSSPIKPNSKPISFLPIQNLPEGLTKTNLTKSLSSSPAITSAAIAGAIFTTLGSVDSALAVQQLADIAEGDNRGVALLLPLVPAIGWVLYNILQPALNQFNRMRSERAVIVGLGLGLSGLTLNGLFSEQAQAVEEVAKVAENSGSDSRGLLLLIVVLPAIAWVLYNILQPALNQLNKMRSQ